MKMLALIVFATCYIFFFLLPRWRWQIGVVGVAVLLFSGCFTPLTAFEAINWNVMGIFVGTLVLADLFMISRMPAVLAGKLVNRAGNVTNAMLLICILTSFISAFVENVATVLIIAPIALSITRKLKISPIPIIIALAISSNLQGTATMIGDPPSMLLAGYTNMDFMDFFFYRGRPSIFWFVEIGAIASFVVLFLIFKPYKQPIVLSEVEKPSTLFPSILLVLFILTLMVASFPGSPLEKLTLGGISMIFAAIGMFWFCLFFNRFQWRSAWRMTKNLDWGTTIFLMCVFILVGALTYTNWIATIADWLAGVTSGSTIAAFLIILIASVIISAFVDNVPYLATMLPVAQRLTGSLGTSPSLILFALLIGSCLGGNITPLGASANIVGMGILKKEGYNLSFLTFVKIGLPFTLVAVATSALALWLVWGH